MGWRCYKWSRVERHDPLTRRPRPRAMWKRVCLKHVVRVVLGRAGFGLTSLVASVSPHELGGYRWAVRVPYDASVSSSSRTVRFGNELSLRLAKREADKALRIIKRSR